MSRFKEQRLWDTMRKNAPADLWVQRVENLTGVGMPDLFVAAPNNVCHWVELKAPIAPKRRSTRVLGNEGLRQGQINWHLKAVTKGMKTFVLIRTDQGDLFMVEGKHAARINEMCLIELESVSIASEWKTVFWNLR